MPCRCRQQAKNIWLQKELFFGDDLFRVMCIHPNPKQQVLPLQSVYIIHLGCWCSQPAKFKLASLAITPVIPVVTIQNHYGFAKNASCNRVGQTFSSLRASTTTSLTSDGYGPIQMTLEAALFLASSIRNIKRQSGSIQVDLGRQNEPFPRSPVPVPRSGQRRMGHFGSWHNKLFPFKSHSVDRMRHTFALTHYKNMRTGDFLILAGVKRAKQSRGNITKLCIIEVTCDVPAGDFLIPLTW